jgi:nucleotide-binding universal stress UspA family protein
MAKIGTVLCPVDFTSVTEQTVYLAAEICLRIGARLVLHHNLGVRPPGYLSVSWMVSEETGEREQRKKAQVPERLEEIFARLPEGLEYEAKVTHAPLDMAVLEVAKRLPADLIVMGSHGWSNPAHRSLTEKVILKAPCTVMTTGESCRPPEAWFKPRARPADALWALLPVDFSHRTAAQVGLGFELTRWMPHRLRLLHVLPEGASEKDRRRAEERLAALIPEEHREQADTVVATGSPAAVILETASSEDAVFVLFAAHRKGPLRRLLFGAETLEVLHGSPCPVWFVPEGWTPAREEAAAG